MKITDYNLHTLAKHGDFEKLNEILNAASAADKKLFLNTLDAEKGWSPLHYAIIEEHLNVVQLLLQHGTDPNLRNKYTNKPLMVFAISGVWSKRLSPYALTEEIVRLLLDYDADPTLSTDDGENALFSALEKVNFKVVYCLLKHPKVKISVKEGLLKDYQIAFEMKAGHTALHKLVAMLNSSGVRGLAFEKVTKRCLYAFLLSGIDVKEKLPTLILHLNFGDEECTRLNHLLTEAEEFIKQARKEFGHLGEEVVHQCIFSSKQEWEVFSREKFWVRWSGFFRNEVATEKGVSIVAKGKKPDKKFPAELAILVAQNIAPKSIHFLPTTQFKDKALSVDEALDVRQLTI